MFDGFGALSSQPEKLIDKTQNSMMYDKIEV
jgi:hypothetical protein